MPIVGSIILLIRRCVASGPANQYGKAPNPRLA